MSTHGGLFPRIYPRSLYVTAIGCLAFVYLYLLKSKLYPLQSKQFVLACLRSYDSETDEGIGAIVTRNNLLFYLSDLYSARIAWFHQISSHRYDIQRLFSSCPIPSPNCFIDSRRTALMRCARGDCECMAASVRPFSDPLALRCEVLGVHVDQFRSTEYFGCFRSVLKRYFVHNLVPAFEYDALHYRMGDVAWDPGNKSFSQWELQSILQQFCILSDRPLVVLTEGTPQIPRVSCFGRVILAADASLNDTFTIMHYAKIIAVGDSTFAFSLAEVSSPEHVIVLQRSLEKYEWMSVSKWTVVDGLGISFHFANKRIMLDSMLSEARSKARTVRYGIDPKERMVSEIPKTKLNDSFWGS